MTDESGVLRHFERDLIVAAVVLAGLALLAPGGSARLAVGVLSGGALVWGSFRSLKAGIDAALLGSGGPATLVKIFTRYAILAFAAYVMLARLRLHPLGVLIGASSIVLAAAAAAVRGQRSRGPVRPE